MNWYYKPSCLFYSLQREQNITQVFIFSDWRVALLSIPSTTPPPPPSHVTECRKQRKQTGRFFLNRFCGGDLAYCFLFQLFPRILSLYVRALNTYGCVISITSVWMVLIRSHLPVGIIQSPPDWLCLSLPSLSLAVPGFPSPISLKVRFSGKIQETSSCFIHSLLLGIPRWEPGAVKFLFGPIALIVLLSPRHWTEWSVEKRA